MNAGPTMTQATVYNFYPIWQHKQNKSENKPEESYTKYWPGESNSQSCRHQYEGNAAHHNHADQAKDPVHQCRTHQGTAAHA